MLSGITSVNFMDSFMCTMFCKCIFITSPSKNQWTLGLQNTGLLEQMSLHDLNKKKDLYLYIGHLLIWIENFISKHCQPNSIFMGNIHSIFTLWNRRNKIDYFCFTLAREKELSNNCVITIINVSIKEYHEEKWIRFPSNLLYTKTAITFLN